MGKILFLDIDGTLINYSGVMPDSAREAVMEARKKSHRVYTCTGCSKYEILLRLKDLEVDGYIGANGGYLEDNGKELLHTTFSDEQIGHIVNWCNSRNLGIILECNSGLYANREMLVKGKNALYRYASGNGRSDQQAWKDAEKFLSDFIIMEDDQMYRDDVNKVSFTLDSYQTHLDSVKEFRDMEVNVWGSAEERALFGDLTVKGVTKKHAIELLLDHLKADRKDAIAFGDSAIDIGMFECCGFSVAMGNGDDKVKAAADYLSEDVDNDGLYKAFRYLKLI